MHCKKNYLKTQGELNAKNHCKGCKVEKVKKEMLTIEEAKIQLELTVDKILNSFAKKWQVSIDYIFVNKSTKIETCSSI
jgi:hypothetical protein